MNEKIRCFKNANGKWSVRIPPEFSSRFAAPGVYERSTFIAARSLVVARVNETARKKAAAAKDANRSIPLHP